MNRALVPCLSCHESRVQDSLDNGGYLKIVSWTPNWKVYIINCRSIVVKSDHKAIHCLLVFGQGSLVLSLVFAINSVSMIFELSHWVIMSTSIFNSSISFSQFVHSLPDSVFTGSFAILACMNNVSEDVETNRKMRKQYILSGFIQNSKLQHLGKTILDG